MSEKREPIAGEEQEVEAHERRMEDPAERFAASAEDDDDFQAHIKFP